MRSHQEIAEEILGHAIEPGGYAPCPGAHCHTTPGGRRDWRIIIDPTGQELPHEHCFHASCQAERDSFMSRLYSAIRAEERAANGGAATPPRAASARRTPPAPRPAPPPKPALDLERAERLAARAGRSVTEADLRAASPLRIPADAWAWPELLLDTLYPPGTRILIFYNYYSQGDYLRVCGRGNYALANSPRQRATPWEYPLPEEGANGAWYLCAPVTGQWLPNPGNCDKQGRPRLGRRHQACCLSYPYAVIESDVLPPETWLPILAQLKAPPIAAVYTSGGKSYHAIVRVGCNTYDEFAEARARLTARLPWCGADKAAISAVRLTRLPGVWRLNKMAGGSPTAGLQRLLYLNPAATATAAGRPDHSIPPILSTLNALDLH